MCAFFFFFFFHYRYPHVFFLLDMLQGANFREAMAHPANKVSLQFHFFLQFRNYEILKCSVLYFSYSNQQNELDSLRVHF